MLPSTRRGFTLVELLMVLVVIGVVATALVTVRWGSRGALALNHEAPRLLATLSLCRERAVQTGRPHRLALDLDARRYWIEWETDPLDARGTYEAFSEGGRTEHEWDSDVGWEEISFEGTVEFEPDAEETEGIYYLYFEPEGSTRSTRIVLFAGSEERRILEISGFTGRTRIIEPTEAKKVFGLEEEDREFLLMEASQ